MPTQKLYGPKKIALITGFILVGIAISLFRRYHETGRIGGSEVVAVLFTLAIAATIVVLIVRKGNKKE